jgi:hypothetical protein
VPAPALPRPSPTDDTVLRGDLPGAPAPVAGQEQDSTLTRIRDVPEVPALAPGEEAAPPGRPRATVGLWAGIAAGVVILAVVAVAAFAIPALLGEPEPKASASSAPPKPVDALPATVAAPTDLTGVVKGASVVWTWKNPDPADGAVFLWRDVSRADEPGRTTKSTEPTVTQPADSSGRTCIEVRTLRADGASSEAATRCVQ